MKKICWVFVGLLTMVHCGAMAVTIKKAAPVSVQKSTAMESTGSLVPTVVSLVSGIKEINQKQKDLTAECIPTSQEITFVNNLVKEWAKAGEVTAEEFGKSLGMDKCSTPTGEYASNIQVYGPDDSDMLCYDYFGGSGDKDMVWENFPMAATAYYCSDGSVDSCSDKVKRHVTNMYDIFSKIGFTEADYVGSNELTMANKLITKVEQCSYARLSAQQKALWSSFLIESIGNVGQKTNTGSIMEIVSSVANTGGGGGGLLDSLGGLGSVATQFLGGQ